MAKVITENEHLFDGEVQFKPDVAAIDSTAGRVGEYLASGTGKVKGPRITGEITNDMFEKSDENFCEANIKGVIATEDGAEIKFDLLGLNLAPEAPSPIWKLTGGVTFSTTDKRYEWINKVIGTWEGLNEPEKMRMRFKVYSRS